MKIITPDSNPCCDDAAAIFAQGAKVILQRGECQAGLWCGNTPVFEGETIGTVGACRLTDSPEASGFISDCADYLHKTYGCNNIVGPMNGNTWLQHRLILESNGRAPFLMEPMEPVYFQGIFEKAGFSILSRYSSSLIDLTELQRDFSSMATRLGKKGVSFRNINTARFENDLDAIYDLSLTSFSNNFLYTPLPKEQFVGKYMSAREHIDPELVILAERFGELVGFVFCMPDLLAAQLGKKPAVIIKTLAALPDRSLSGVGTVLVAKAQQIAKEKGYTEAIHALQYESNSSLRISERFNAEVFRRYGLMIKSYS